MEYFLAAIHSSLAKSSNVHSGKKITSLSLSFSLSLSLSHTHTHIHTHLSPFLPTCCQFSSVAQSCLHLCDHKEPQHTRLPCPSPTPGAYSNSLSQWCHPTIPSSVVPFSSHLQSFPASGSFPMSQFFASGGQSIGVSASASVLPMNIQDQFPLGCTGWISLQSKELSRVFSNTTECILYSPEDWPLPDTPFFFTWAVLVSFINQGIQIGLVNLFRDYWVKMYWHRPSCGIKGRKVSICQKAKFKTKKKQNNLGFFWVLTHQPESFPSASSWAV